LPKRGGAKKVANREEALLRGKQNKTTSEGKALAEKLRKGKVKIEMRDWRKYQKKGRLASANIGGKKTGSGPEGAGKGSK